MTAKKTSPAPRKPRTKSSGADAKSTPASAPATKQNPHSPGLGIVDKFQPPRGSGS